MNLAELPGTTVGGRRRPGRQQIVVERIYTTFEKEALVIIGRDLGSRQGRNAAEAQKIRAISPDREGERFFVPASDQRAAEAYVRTSQDAMREATQPGRKRSARLPF